jgi:NADPH:quinone reductase-like Zn-dependent oxidoreductase
MVPGHETIGEVVALGPNETLWKVGDRVGAPWHGGHDGLLRSIPPDDKWKMIDGLD